MTSQPNGSPQGLRGSHDFDRQLDAGNAAVSMRLFSSVIPLGICAIPDDPTDGRATRMRLLSRREGGANITAPTTGQTDPVRDNNSITEQA
ncbi:hypothetical protein [Bifidobacterium apri]|uniref:hypothetical protein n=1 Tax=Bifidobacterium apri TaxID=1769423 RepID=UPI00406BCEF9